MARFRLLGYYIIKCHSECVSTNQRPGRPSYFSDWPEKHKLGRGRWDLASCQVSLNSVQRRSRKCLGQSEEWAAILFFRSAQKTQTWCVEDAEILLPVKFRWIPFSGFREVKNVSANQRPGQPFCFSDGPKNTNLVEDIEILLPVKFRWIPFSISEKSKIRNLTTNRQTDGQRVITIVHLSLWLRCTKKQHKNATKNFTCGPT